MWINDEEMYWVYMYLLVVDYLIVDGCVYCIVDVIMRWF